MDIGGIGGYIGKATGLCAGLVEGLPDIVDSGSAGTGLIAVKGIVNHTLFPRPVNGLLHILGGGLALAPRRAVQEGQNLGLGAVLTRGEFVLLGAVGNIILYRPDPGSVTQFPTGTSVKVVGGHCRWVGVVEPVVELAFLHSGAATPSLLTFHIL